MVVVVVVVAMRLRSKGSGAVSAGRRGLRGCAKGAGWGGRAVAVAAVVGGRTAQNASTRCTRKTLPSEITRFRMLDKNRKSCWGWAMYFVWSYFVVLVT